MRAGNDEWVRRLPIWDGYFALVAIASTALTLTDDPPVPHRVGAVLLLGLLTAGYLAVGRRLIAVPGRGWPPLLYQAAVVAVFPVAAWLAPASATALFALCAQAFLMLGATGGTVTVVVLGLGWFGTALCYAPDVGSVLTGPFLPALIGLALSAVIGAWAQYIIRQSAERATLIRDLERTRAELARLSYEAGQAAERDRFADVIHDTIAQGLSSALMLMQAADTILRADPERARRHLAVARRTAEESLADARSLIAARPATEAMPAALPDALRRELDRLGEVHEVDGTLRVEGAPRSLDTPLEVMLLRGGQEALANVGKHARATTVDMLLRFDADEVTLEVRDNGCGFALDLTEPGHGLRSMRERVSQAAGRLTIESQPGAGSTVRLEVPAG
ncbi:sensor histidine kinase [Parafrankia elaeagni]|uniref:sensor histidine kinase n=1 Tax=Parafrankia elaeagni TaxID=222534 RepID=UPI00036BE196|nr:sensor histidine kinase [Parafrankia elaeagni]